MVSDPLFRLSLQIAAMNDLSSGDDLPFSAGAQEPVPDRVSGGRSRFGAHFFFPLEGFATGAAGRASLTAFAGVFRLDVQRPLIVSVSAC